MTVDDVDAMYDIYSDESITKYTENLYENRDDEIEFTRAYINNMYKFYEYGIWVVTKKNGEIIGRAGISNREIDGENELEAGYVIGKKYQRSGYGYEAVNAIVTYAFEELEAKRLNCFIKKGNIISEKFAQKLGFEKIDVAKCDNEEYIRYVKEKNL